MEKRGVSWSGRRALAHSSCFDDGNVVQSTGIMVVDHEDKSEPSRFSLARSVVDQG